MQSINDEVPLHATSLEFLSQTYRFPEVLFFNSTHSTMSSIHLPVTIHITDRKLYK
jgi:hypothetical protein